MFFDPNKLAAIAPGEVLDASAHGHLGLDHRFLRAFVDREEQALPAVLAFSRRDRRGDPVDLAPELLALFRHWKTPEAVPFLIDFIREDPENVPDEVIEALVAVGSPALEPLLAIYKELDESESGEVAFILANLRVRDKRILQILTDRLAYDLSDTLLLFGVYGDPAAAPAIEKAAAEFSVDDVELKKEAADTLESLKSDATENPGEEPDPFDIWALYPEEDELPIDLLGEDERVELLGYPVPSVRAAAAHSFFNRELTPEVRSQILALAQHDKEVSVRARAWEALINSTEEAAVVEPMLRALRNPALPVEERGGLLVGLAPEADRNEVRNAITELYGHPECRSKALEAMWRSMHPSFRDNFARHLEDNDLEVRRGAIWGVGYYGLKAELDRLRKLFGDEDLRSDALFAYALALPGETSRGRMKSMLTRIEKEALGLSEMEEELVKAALDERLMLAGKEPVFRQEED